MSTTTLYARSLSASFNLHLGVLYAYLTMFLVIVFCIFVKNKYPDLFTSSTAATVQDEEDNDEASLTEKIQKLSTDDRYQYYNEVFNKTGNQIELSSNQIVTVNNANNDGEGKLKLDIDDDDDDDDDDEEPSVYLSLGSVWNSMGRKSSIILKNAFQTKKAATVADCSGKDDTVVGVDDKQNKSNTKSVNGNSKNNIVSGNCVICFENLKEGDTIVYNSETKNCPHIYHKECMVDYLVRRKIFKKQVKKDEEANPLCPTCRQTFCKLISLDDVTVLSKDSKDFDTSEEQQQREQ